ncbi:hypothetical protein [Atopobium fossor]|uniref:hypothetical protein n=1 Tax=Atopobium fossor TaxID=39487 RepID=UPI0003FD4ABB|nr:hypothetical protein [Atopobium fossor]
MTIRTTSAKIALVSLMASGLVLAPVSAPIGFSPTVVPTVSVAQAREAGVYETTGGGYTLSQEFSWAQAKKATTVRVCSDISDSGTLDIPSFVTNLQGWQKKSILSAEGPKLRRIGGGEALSVNFGKDNNIAVSDIDFGKAGIHTGAPSAIGSTVTVKSGAKVTFKNCSFVHTPVIEAGAKAAFDNCTFVTKKIDDRSHAATFSGSTEKPTNIAAPVFEKITITLEGKFPELTEGTAVDASAAVDVMVTEGSGAPMHLSDFMKKYPDATTEVTLDPAALGLTAKIDTDKLILQGTPKTSGTYSVQVKVLTKDGRSAMSNALSFDIAKKAPITYTMTAPQSFVQGEKAVFTSSADNALFVDVLVDGAPIPSTMYERKSGSTVITLLPAYTKTLQAGAHKLDIVSQDGLATANFMVTAATPSNPSTPGTTPGTPQNPKPQGGNGPVNTTKPTTNGKVSGKTNGKASGKSTLPKTGDATLPGALAMAAVAGASVIGASAYLRRKDSMN